jgi:hypothetical protein
MQYFEGVRLIKPELDLWPIQPYARVFVEYHTAAPYKKPRMRCPRARVL